MKNKRVQYNQGSGSNYQITPMEGVYMPSVQNTVEGLNTLGSLIGSAASAVAQQMANPAVLAGSQGVASNLIPSTVDPVTLPPYSVKAPRPVESMSAGTTGSMALQRMASGVGRHPGGANRGKGAGGSLGQETRQARKRKIQEKRAAKRKAKEDNDYAEGGRVGYAVGGGVISKLASKMLKQYEKGGRSFSKAETKARNKINEELAAISAKDAAPRDSIDQVYQIKNRLEDIDNELGGIGDDIIEQRSPETRDLLEERRILVSALKDIEKEGSARYLFFDDESGTYTDVATYRAYTEKSDLPPMEDDIPFAEGGNVDAQMAELMPEEGMVPDEEMEDNYIDFIVGESLTPEDEEYLLTALEQDDRLSVIFDQVVETASEFAGSGPVEGPGTGMSDSIPARLSDGEFVITAKATEEIGPDNLQSMMEQAEMDADVRQAAYSGGLMENTDKEETVQQNMFSQVRDETQTDKEMKKLMLSANPRSSILFKPAVG